MIVCVFVLCAQGLAYGQETSFTVGPQDESVSQQIVSSAKATPDLTSEDQSKTAPNNPTDELSEDYHEDEILEEMKLTASVWADLLGAALSETNWREIAKNLLENVEVKA